MIFDALSSFIFFVLNGFLSLLPLSDSAITTGISSQLTSFRSNIAVINWLFPVDTFFSLLGMVFAVESLYFSYKAIRWVIGAISFGFIKS